jgi:hypothetical protein
MTPLVFTICFACILTTPAVSNSHARAAAPATVAREDRGPIQDNSFLVEEAYNQEPGVIQHISTFQRYRQSRDWVYTLTQEWPVPRETHQFSYTVPFERLHASSDGSAGPGDVALNYRYQLLGDGRARVAIAPRFSLLLPLGDPAQSRGAGVPGYQVNVPVSFAASARFVTHSNVGMTLTPQQQNAAGDRASTAAWNIGQSVVWLAHPNVNGLLEIVYSAGETVVAPGRTASARSCFLSPGVRWAMNMKGGLQIVPGVAIPIGVGPSRGERTLFFYLSFEHPLWQPR